MKKVFSILLALALLAVAGFAMADAEQKVPVELATREGNIVLTKSTCHSYGTALIKITAESEAPKGAKIVTDDKGNIYYEATVDVLPHNWQYVTAGSPICTDNGAVTRVCKNEGCHVTDADYLTVGADIHDYGTWTVLSESTCTVKGVKVRICNRCLAEQYAEMDLAKHQLKACTAEQLKANNKENIAATCTTDGTKWKICVVCESADTLKSVKVDKLGHVYDMTKTPETEGTFLAPTCKTTGWAKYICTRCKSTEESAMKTVVLAKLPHKYEDDKWWNEHHMPTCTEDGSTAVYCTNKFEVPELDAEGNPVLNEDGTPVTYFQVCGDMKTTKVKATGHNWGEWKVVVEPSETTKGIWEHYCQNKGCKSAEHFVGDKLDNADRDNGLKEVDGEWIYVENDKPVTDKTGIVEFEGGKFLIVNGKLEKVTKLYEVTEGQFILLIDGKVSSYTGLVEYDGAWFYLENGKVATNVCGLKAYDGAEFVVANGQVLTGLNGLWQDHNSTEWYYIAAGKKTTYTGLAQYDGAWFYVTNGKLDTTFSGEVEYDGATFTVVNGMLAL